MTTAKNSSKRQQLITKIHIAKSQLNLDDDTYRALLNNAVGKTSCRDMQFGELYQVYEAMKTKGFKPKPTANSQRRGSHSPKSQEQQIDKLRALWITMFQHGMIADGSEAALLAWVKRQSSQLNGGVGIDSLEWLQQNTRMTNAVLESLKQWQQRIERKWQHEDILRIEQCRAAVPTASRTKVIGYLLDQKEIMWWPEFAELNIEDSPTHLRNRNQLKGMNHGKED
ncbi:Uncharacterised protein [BD1-7 clade bacterium]|uniref:Regulatory protein GemA n=1 Tax=BD1-7 clade bacterium TaxID=2029982 RepID=A0A5S9Q2M4_9GAMM|nr:Uncharacterised protein [BD1-7 clade bacterium]CAA0111825.1 Uncharacterised protein [BD1-7 clade bacterium]